jgi:hypothetical protein
MKKSISDWLTQIGQSLLCLLIAFNFILAIFAGSISVQSMEYGPALLSIALGTLIHFELKLMQQFKLMRPPDVSISFLTQWHQNIVLATLALPIIMSWLNNGNLAAAWNPIGYWRAELKEAKAADCNIFRNALANSLEELQVAEKKYSLGITTSSDVNGAAKSVKAINDIHKNCLSEIQNRISNVNTRLATLTSK